MNRRLLRTIQHVIRDAPPLPVFLDLLNDTYFTDHAPTITTRVYLSHINFIMEQSVIDDSYASRPPREYDDVAPALRSSREVSKVVDRCVQVADLAIPGRHESANRVYSDEGCSPTINTGQGGGHETKIAAAGIRVRRLTERELYRLMDVDEEDIDKLLASDIARTQHAKLAGNSIVVACLEHIFYKLFINPAPAEGEQIRLL